MKKTSILVLILLLIVGGAALAQDVTPAVPFADAPPLETVVPDPNDARLASCSAPTLDGFAPYIVRAGDTLASLLAGVDTLTAAQLAALNCLDDTAALPVGAAIWLPETSAAFVPPAAEATAEAVAPEFLDFSLSAETVTSGAGVTINWAANGDRAYIYPCPPTEDECARPRGAAPVPLTGSLTIPSFQYAGTYRYQFEVEGAGERIAQTVSFEVACSQEWLGGIGALPLCPEQPPLAVFGVWQPFEGGAMIWFSDTQEIYVMTNADGRVRIYRDVYIEGQPDPGQQAPEGRFTPVRGFGQIWDRLGGENGHLGWALSAEVGYDAARQAAGRTSYTTYIQGPGDTVYAVTLIPGVEAGFWSQVAG